MLGSYYAYSTEGRCVFFRQRRSSAQGGDFDLKKIVGVKPCSLIGLCYLTHSLIGFSVRITPLAYIEPKAGTMCSSFVIACVGWASGYTSLGMR